jgi:hypothetical protein
VICRFKGEGQDRHWLTLFNSNSQVMLKQTGVSYATLSTDLPPPIVEPQPSSTSVNLQEPSETTTTTASSDQQQQHQNFHESVSLSPDSIPTRSPSLANEDAASENSNNNNSSNTNIRHHVVKAKKLDSVVDKLLQRKLPSNSNLIDSTTTTTTMARDRRSSGAGIGADREKQPDTLEEHSNSIDSLPDLAEITSKLDFLNNSAI